MTVPNLPWLQVLPSVSARWLMLICVCTLFLSCSDGSQTRPIKPDAVEKLEREAGFELIWPAVLPPSVDAAPQTEFMADVREAWLTYYPLERQNGAPVIFVREKFDPDEISCPPCPANPVALESTELDGRTLHLREGPGPGGTSLEVYFRDHGVRVAVVFNWVLPAETPPVVTESMRAEALGIIRSMLDEGR